MHTHAHTHHTLSATSQAPQPRLLPTPSPATPNEQVRLTFRPDLGQLWIGSATATQKLAYGSVRRVEAWPVEGQEAYSIVALHLGSGKLWLYWVPSQLVSTLKVRLIGVGALVM
jgi:hypothetical protein